MNTLARTTITLPEYLLDEAKMYSLLRKITLSELIRKTLEKEIRPLKKRKIHMLLGKYSLGITSTLSRKEIYDEWHKRKMSP